MAMVSFPLPMKILFNFSSFFFFSSYNQGWYHFDGAHMYKNSICNHEKQDFFASYNLDDRCMLIVWKPSFCVFF